MVMIWFFREAKLWVKLLVTIYFGLIAISTVTTKQHVVLDIPGGIVYGPVSYTHLTTKQGKSVVQRTARTVFVTDRAERTVTRLARITKRENSAAQKTKAGTALVTGNNN